MVRRDRADVAYLVHTVTIVIEQWSWRIDASVSGRACYFRELNWNYLVLSIIVVLAVNVMSIGGRAAVLVLLVERLLIALRSMVVKSSHMGHHLVIAWLTAVVAMIERWLVHLHMVVEVRR